MWDVNSGPQNYWGLFCAKLAGISIYIFNEKEERINEKLYFLYDYSHANQLFAMITPLCQSSAQMNAAK